MASLDRLFSPIKIGNMEVRNRLVMSPMTTGYANEDEIPSDTCSMTLRDVLFLLTQGLLRPGQLTIHPDP